METVHEPRLLRVLRWMTRFVVFNFALVLFIAAIFIMGLLYLRSQPLPAHQVEETTIIYAADDQVLDTIHQGQNRTYVPLEDIPVHLLQAFLAVEDRRFYEHHGFDLRRIAGAVVSNIQDLSYTEGASTITQQLARNLYLTHDKTWSRKVREAIYAIQLEMHYPKSSILEQYVNQIYFGHSAYGVESAAQLFFNKPVSELSLAESALIAGIPKGPSLYSPWLNEENALSRQELILSLMVENGYITDQEYQEALEEIMVIVHPEDVQDEGHMAPYFRDYIQQVLIRQYGIEEEMVEQGGLRIYTTLDPMIQEVAEEAMQEHLPQDRDLQGALVAVDPRNGYIRAMVGGRDYQESPFNRVFSERQPGSAIKPFLYYAALEEGFTPLTEMKSEPTTFTYNNGQDTYSPRNFNDSYAHDYITLEQAIAQSDNIYAVKTLMHMGKEKMVDTLDRFGFQHSFHPYPSLALGAQNVSLFEMVRGYSAFANNGILNQTQAILRVEDRSGNTLIEAEPVREQILNPVHTFILNRMMRSVFEPGGTGQRVADELHRPVSGKTGSTDWDSWMVGYTPQLVSGVWVGYDQGEPINHNNDGRLASSIWAQFMEEALSEQMPALFPVPDGVTGAYINPDSGRLATEHCPVKRLIYFQEGTAPTEYCPDHLPEEGAEPVPIEVPESNSFWHKLREWWEE